MAGEFEFIDWVRGRQQTSPRVPLAAGDDLAALRFAPDDGPVLVGIDQVLDGVHFDSATQSPERIGAKAMNRNLSDCAAMACLPAAAVVSFALPRGQPVEWTKRLYDAIRAAGETFGCPVVGGDTGSWDGRLAITVAILGRSGGVPFVRRSGAKPGDAVYVTGPLGGSILGRHLDFVPRVREARELVSRYRVSAMIDLSDGLSRDAAHLARESAVGIVLDAAAIPIHDDIARLADAAPPEQGVSSRSGVAANSLASPSGAPTRKQAHGYTKVGTALDHALNDGEDYELCFTGEPGIPTAIRVGTVIEGGGLWIESDGVRRPLRAGAFEHAL